MSCNLNIVTNHGSAQTVRARHNTVDIRVDELCCGHLLVADGEPHAVPIVHGHVGREGAEAAVVVVGHEDEAVALGLGRDRAARILDLSTQRQRR